MAVLGLILLALSLWNLALELSEVATVLGPALAGTLNAALSLSIVVGAIALRRSEFTAEGQWTVAGTSIVAAAVAGTIELYTIWVRLFEGRTLSEPLFPFIVMAASGAIAGAGIGWMYESVRGERERAEEALDAMSFTNSMLRHDVLNGLQILRSHAELIQAQAQDDQLRESGDAMHEQVAGLEDLIENVRSVSDVLLGEAETEPVDLSTLLRETVDTAAESHDTATFETDIPDSLTVAGTPALKPVFTNLLNNAVQHTPDGTHVQVSAANGDDRVTVRVEDDGPGIPSTDRDHIFGRGVTADGGDGGLGLHIVQTILERSGGSVHVTDSDLGGAGFVVELPPAESNPFAGD